MSDNTDNLNKITSSTAIDRYKKSLENAKKYYLDNKEHVKKKTNERRASELLQLLNAGTRKCRNDTLEKYNIVKNDKGVYEFKK